MSSWLGDEPTTYADDGSFHRWLLIAVIVAALPIGWLAAWNALNSAADVTAALCVFYVALLGSVIWRSW